MGVAELLEFHPGRKLTRTGRPYFLKSVALMAIYRRMQLHYTTPGVAPPSRDEVIALRVIVGAIEISIKASTNSNDREAEDEGITKKFDVAMRLALEFCQAYPAVQARWSKRDKNMALEYQNASIEDTKAAKHLQEIMMALKKAHIFSSIPRITFNLVVWHEEMVKWHSAQKVGPYSVAEEYKIEEKASVDIMLCRLIEHFATTPNPLSLAQNPQLYKVFPQSEARFDDIADPLPTDKEEEESPKIICPVFPWVVMKKAMAQSNTLHIVVNRRQAKDKKVRTHTGTVLIPEGYFNLWPFLERAWSPHPEKVVVRGKHELNLLHLSRLPNEVIRFLWKTSYARRAPSAIYGLFLSNEFLLDIDCRHSRSSAD
ncbi:hypothetical protein NLJ89_g731 [Agrocybe chaxingu]|uniref:Uncharacterized protein n=1 Tax=Agrocybe chaxingu TaxID=84603 RepID=A0A9W8N1B3_9AGAR|nr:hypothetical protein NLJ89_g731 [Agrocybe chaxingu]